MDTFKAIFPANDFTLLAAIIALPLLGAVINGIFGKRLGKEAVTLMALATVGASFVGSVVAFFMLRAAQTEEKAARFVWTAWKWVSVSLPGEADQVTSGKIDLLHVDIAFSVDALSGTMALIVTGVGFLIHLYSTKYMGEDDGYHRYFSYLNLFIFSMLVLILGDNLPVLFIGWEGVGLCSYLLIGYWYGDEANAAAGKKAFITNRIGDFGLLVAMALLIRYTGSLSWDGIEDGAHQLLRPMPFWQMPASVAEYLPDALVGPYHVSYATLVALALFLGCAGKSAQFPLYVWLPDAMAGPTPVSALIHAATMVTAGIYLMCRMAAVFVLSPAAMFTVAIIGAFTALLAATIAFAQNDIKKVLAYSTVSQLGYMFLGVGVGAFVAGFFHVITHAFFKACLFLAAGAVIHAMHARIHDGVQAQDIRNMGGLRRYLPITHWTFLVSVLAIIGFPLTSGFFSKDAILLGAYSSSIQPPTPDGMVQAGTGPVELFKWPDWGPSLLLAMGVVGAIMTAFYMVRLYILVFQSEFRGWRVVRSWKPAEEGHHHEEPGERLDGPAPHEAPWQMTAPLVVLGVLAVFGGLWNAHLFHLNSIDEWLKPVFASAIEHVAIAEEANEKLVVGLAVGAFFLGSLAATWMYFMQGGAPARDFAERFPWLHQLVVEKWRVDEIYDEYVIGTVDFIADICVWIDKWVVDGIIAGVTSWLVAASGHVLRLFQTGRVQAYAAVMMVGMAGVGWFMTTPHPEAQLVADPSSGKYSLHAAPGFGYAYRWDADGDGKFDTEDFGTQDKVDLSLNVGEARTVQLEVKNAFGRVATEAFTLNREAAAEPQAQAEQSGSSFATATRGAAR